MIRENPARPDSSSSTNDSVFSNNQTDATSTSSTVLPVIQQDPEVAKAFADICMACRTGDIEVVDSLLSTPNLDINQVDEYNYSPLILSSLCGHYPIVELLLQRGAVCDRDTFQGARCIYGALTDEIRDLLVSFDISKAVDSTQPFAAHIASLLNPLVTNTRDVAFQFKSASGELTSFKLHRFLLAARCPYFREQLLNDGKWAYLTVVNMPESVDPSAFKVIMDYIYLRTDSIAIDDTSIQAQLIELARKYKLPDLLTGIEKIKQCKDDKERAKVKHDLAFQFVETARGNLDEYLDKYVWNEKMVSPMDLEEDVDIDDINSEEFITEEQRSTLLEADSIPDIILSCIDSETESVVYYPVNKSILARSEYFDTMFKSDIFKYSQEDIPVYKDKIQDQEIINRPQLQSEHLPVVQITTTTTNQNVAQMILSYLYHDDVKHIPLPLTIELLLGADELFLERLKTMCAVNISSQFNSFTFDELLDLKLKLGYNAYDLIRIAWQTRCDKLEQHLTKMIAYNLHKLFQVEEEREEFAKLIEESAARIKERHETDTIELIDDIRYYLSKKYAVHTEFQSLDPAMSFRDPDAKPAEHIQLYKTALMNYDKDIEIIDYFLSELQLDA
ncbi:uncharacterized protein SPAPADRAFT_144561 [Spathaspora passalidarum NRRL Y-27907]|uniref:BTB domain-containing protein n=1 Tax=Spathaspora passalidarum (strain NRRL Y-27907 / 11-Y1) TaxID=619300 RepID=G3AVB6_SPAPN|nr:uncharacterized protein SPAPADRAFT_144561 [Spathaspora passalidarum NRRL Y-27907]EGW30135.1 hypothetical protein SPAPADRAFT_144561 [Spathaspora passalidarum NRRL Y-27907]